VTKATPPAPAAPAKKDDDPISVDTIFKDDYAEGSDPYSELNQLDEMDDNSNYGAKEEQALSAPLKASEMKKFEKNEKSLLDEIITGTGIKKSVGKN